MAVGVSTSVSPGPSSADPRFSRDRVVASWLITLAAMVFVMVVIGGLTRLTQSGLSIVEWRPVTGWLPPLGEAEWEALFAAYRQTPEYRYVNAGMTLTQFKDIFWLEYVHRLWGRLIGVAFLVPFLAFAIAGWIGRSLAPKLGLAFVLGGLQGALGWFMVASGLVDRPDVSHFRLAAHFGAALLIYGYLLWIAWSIVEKGQRTSESDPRSGLVSPMWPAIGVLVLIVLTMLAGGLVAGLDAGLVYNTFPLMGDALVPMEVTGARFPLSLIEVAGGVQFLHRVLAMVTLVAVIAFWLMGMRRNMPPGAKVYVHSMALVALVQVGLGIATLLLVVPITLALAHQVGAVVLFTLALRTLFLLSRVRGTRDVDDRNMRPVKGDQARPGEPDMRRQGEPNPPMSGPPSFA